MRGKAKEMMTQASPDFNVEPLTLDDMKFAFGDTA